MTEANRKLKIVHAVYSMEMGGAEVLVAQLCRIQRAQGHDVSVFAYARLGVLGEALRAEGFEVYVPGEAHPAKTIFRYLLRFRAMRPDVVHCHNPAPTLHAAIAARIAGVGAIVATRHSLVAPPYDVPGEVKFNLVSWCCDWVVGICDITRRNLEGTPLARRAIMRRVYNGTTPVEAVAGPALEKRGFTLLFLGRLAEVKDLPTLIRAVALALPRVPGLELWIVGDGPVRAALNTLTAELGIAAHIRFWGMQMETAPFFHAADVLTMSSVSEGVPMSLLQAMSVGVPALVTDVGGMAEVVRSAQCGLLTPVGNAGAMADAIVRLATEQELRAELGGRARAGYQAHFTLDEMNRGYMELYCAANSGSGSRDRRR